MDNLNISKERKIEIDNILRETEEGIANNKINSIPLEVFIENRNHTVNQDERSYIEALVNEINEEHKNMDADALPVHDVKLDLKDETTGESIYNLEDPIENALKYRNDFSKLGMIFECDVAIRTMVIFSKVFPYVTRDGRNINLQKCERKENPYQYNQQKLKVQIGNLKEHEYVYRGDIMNSYMGTINAYKRAFGEELPNEARMFVRFAHTIGNMTPVPFVRKGEEFNSPRGLDNKIINDYWDLTLLAIYNWFLKQNGKVPMYDLDLIDVVQTKKSVLMCEKWLGNFKNKNGKLSWDEFVIENFMGAFVEKQETRSCNNEEGIYGMPKELWDNHFKTFRDEARPVSKEEYMQFFTNTKTAISQRGYKISKALIRAQRSEMNY